ncbi:unnamed protein product [Mytilus coruscus]|uniref:Reverse transcriptase RNase H-like domain-containing protein n=1 Tax=Mytilus coruscus TaxID=42192 RepID=A0A6J8ASJ8_MYTCO|nr:unnamed protein product [Mytilus coruscus]
MKYNHGQSTSNSYSEHRVNNVSDRNYNIQYEHPVTSITGISSSASHPDEPKFRLPCYNGKAIFRVFGVSLKLELGSSIGTTVNSGKKTSSVRQLEMEETEEYTDLEVRKVNGGRPRFVTEERLESRLGVFAKEIQHEIKDGHTQLRNDFKDEIGKLSSAIKGNFPNKNVANRKQNDSPKFSLKDTTCYTCQRKGHIRVKLEKVKPNSQDLTQTVKIEERCINTSAEMLNVKILNCNNKGGNEDFNTNTIIDECIDNSFEIFDTDLDTAMVDVIIDRVRSVTLRAPLSIEGQKVKDVVDTAKRPSLQEAKRNLVVAGKRMKTLGVAEVSVEIGPLNFLWSIYVAPIGDDLLLGCDVIDEKDITINTKRGLEIQGVWIDCDVQRRSDNVARILLKETVTIPPNSEVILEGHGVNCETIDTRYGSIEPVIEDERKILVARCLVDPFQDNIPVRLVNLDSFPVKIRKNYLLGEIHPVIKYDNFVYEDRNSYNIFSSTDGLNNWVEIGKGISQGDVIEPPNIPDDLNCFKVSSLDTINNGVQANTPKLPDHLKDLYEKSCVKLSKSKDKLNLADVLIKNQNAFAKYKTDLAPVLSYPLPNIPFILDTDASNVGIGAVLSQVHNEKEMVFAFGSKKLDKHQQRYSVTPELLAVITFILQYRHYLSGQKKSVTTDHGSLKWLFGFKDPQGQVARWLEFLFV